jgi:hypothetical protein
MKNTFLGSIIFLTFILVAGLYLSPFIKQIEGFSSLLSPGNFPESADKVILNDYPQIGKNVTSNENYSDIWSNYPIFSLGSFKQITNNLRFHRNPDNGQCIRADFCGAMYKDNKHTKTNVVLPLPPAQEGTGARVGYFRSDPNELYFSIPTNENILY